MQSHYQYIYIIRTATCYAVLLLVSETTTRGTVCSKGLPLMAVRALCGVLSMGMRFIRVSSDMVGHYLGEEKKRD